MNKGYAFGFLIVVLVLLLGLYVAFTGFVSSRETVRLQPTPVVSTNTVQALPGGINLTPMGTATLLIAATPTGEAAAARAITATAVVTQPSSLATMLPLSSDQPLPPATAPASEPAAVSTDTPQPVVQPPTPASAPAQQYRLAGPPAADPNHPCCYIHGTVRDAAGNGLEGVRVQVFNEWTTLPPAVTKGGAETGVYDIPINRDVVTWYVVVVDAAGNRVSSQAPVSFDPNIANAHRVDWQRTY